MEITRPVASLLSIAALFFSLATNVESAEVIVLAHKGELNAVADGEARELKSREIRKPLDAMTTLRSGPVLQADELSKLMGAPAASYAALAYSPREMITLSPGSTATRTEEAGGAPAYRLSGAVFVHIDGAEDKSALAYRINGVALSSQKAVIFYNGWTAPPAITAISGNLVLAASKPDAAEPDAPIEPGTALSLGPAGTIRKPADPADEKLQQWARVPGFQTAGRYERAGVALPSDGSLRLIRMEREITLTGKRIPVMVSDQLRTDDGQRVRLFFDNGDRMRLTGESRFTIDAYSPKPSGQFILSFVGRLRALIGSRSPDTLRIKMPTAVVGVKGTDFQSIASPATAEVSVLDGVVGVADPAGAGEVTVTEGMRTRVAAGQLPQQPEPIPPDELQQLQGESIPPESITIRAPEPDRTMRTGTLAYEITPADARVEVSLNGAPSELTSGSALGDLDEGPHNIRVSALGGGEPSATVTFTIDRTPPILQPAPPTDGIALVADAPLELSWNEAASAVTLTVDGEALPFGLNEDKRGGSASVPPALLAKAALTFTLKVEDAAGNVSNITGQLKPPPAKLKLTIGAGGDRIILAKRESLEVSASVAANKWQIFVDDENLSAEIE